MIEEIQKLCNKNPKIGNMFIRFYNNKEVSFTDISESYSFIMKNKKVLTSSGVNFSQIVNYSSLMRLLFNFGYCPPALSEKAELLNRLTRLNIPYDEYKGQIQIIASDYIIAKNFGAESWCISRSKAMYDSYNKEKKTIIVYTFSKEESIKDIIGVTSNFSPDKSDLSLFNIDNKKELSHDLFIISKDYKISTMDIKKQGKIEFFLYYTFIFNILFSALTTVGLVRVEFSPFNLLFDTDIKLGTLQSLIAFFDQFFILVFSFLYYMFSLAIFFRVVIRGQERQPITIVYAYSSYFIFLTLSIKFLIIDLFFKV